MSLIYLLLIPIVFAPLACIYLTLRVLNWSPRSSLLWDAGLFWLGWWTATALSFLIYAGALRLFLFDNVVVGVGNFLYIFSIEFLVIGFLIFVLRSQRESKVQMDIINLATTSGEMATRPNAIITAGAVSGASLLTLVVSVLVTFLGSAVYFHFFPKNP